MASTINTRTPGKGSGPRRTAGLLAATLGLGLLAGGVLGEPRPPGPAAAPADQRVNPYWTYQEDVVLNGNPAHVALPNPAPDFGPLECGAPSCVSVLAQPVVIVGETPCPLGETVPCGLAGAQTGGSPVVPDHDRAVSDGTRPGFIATPGGPTAPAGVTDSATLRFREDNAAPAADFTPDEFTYREDRRHDR